MGRAARSRRHRRDAGPARRYAATPVDARALEGADDARGRELVRCLAVTGFAAANVMLLSVSVWSGAEGATRDLFHWVSALIALPAVVYGGRPFFRSASGSAAGGAGEHGRADRLAVLLASAVSLAETMAGRHHAYFDAAVSLLFFLLLGRVLDHMMRARATSAWPTGCAARLYAPVVHVLALATLLGWLGLGAGWHPAMMAAIATLIITCPCALGLAVPVVQVVASDVLFREGVMVKNAAALEKLANVTHVVLDKTGTLTMGRMRIVGAPEAGSLALAAGLAEPEDLTLLSLASRDGGAIFALSDELRPGAPAARRPTRSRASRL